MADLDKIGGLPVSKDLELCLAEVTVFHEEIQLIELQNTESSFVPLLSF